MKKITIKPETLLSVGLTALGIAQMVLGQQKDKTDKAMLKEEVVKEVMEQMSNK